MPIITIENWALGLWIAGPPAKNPRGTLTRMTNVQCMDEGTITTRNGCTKKLPLAGTMDGAFISGMHFYKAGGVIYDHSGTSLGIVQGGNDLRVAAASTTGLQDDMVFFPKAMKKVFQGVASNWGISDTPTAAVPTATGGAGALTGTYSYVLRFFNSVTSEFSNLSPPSTAVTVAAGQISVGNISTSASGGADTVQIYRDHNASPGTYYYLDSVSLGTSSYVDVLPDASLGVPGTPTVATPLTPTAIPVGGVGLLNGDYTYRIDFYSSTTFEFSEVSPVSAVASPALDQVTVSVGNSLNPNVDTVRIYRTKAGVSGRWYYLDSVGNGVPTYIDNIDDASLGDPVEPTITLAPSPVLATNLDGLVNLTGDYTYYLAFYASTTHTLSPLSPLSANVNLTNGAVVVGNIPGTSTDPQVDMVQIFRTQGGITGAWYYVDEVPLGITSYVDNVADPGLGDMIDVSLISPPLCNVAGKYKNYLLSLDVVSNPRYVWPSMGSLPEEYSSLVFTILMDAGDTAQFMLEMGDYAMILGQRGIYVGQIDNAGTIYTSRVVSGHGTVNGRTVAMGDLGIYFLSDDGVYIISGFNVYKMSDSIDALFRGTDRGGLSTIADPALTNGTFVGGRYYLCYYGVDGQWHTVVYNERKQRWKHFTGWHWTTFPEIGTAWPYVGLPDSVGFNDFTQNTDDGATFPSAAGFNLPNSLTVLMDIRHFRMSFECVGTATFEFWDGETLKYSVDFTGYTFDDAYFKHSTPEGIYFLQPEIRVSCPDKPFTLKMFEADVDYVRKYEADYTRSAGGSNNSTA